MNLTFEREQWVRSQEMLVDTLTEEDNGEQARVLPSRCVALRRVSSVGSLCMLEGSSSTLIGCDVGSVARTLRAPPSR